MSESIESGFFILESMKIKSLSSGQDIADITFKIKDFTINESMSKTYLSGVTRVLDTGNILESLIGEETLEIVYSDFFNDTITETYYIYALTNVVPYSAQQDIGVGFDLSFCSLDKLISDSISIRKSYNNITTTEMAQNTFDEYFKASGVEKPLELIGETEGSNQLVIPGYRGGEAMDFLARKCFSMVDRTSYFRFWETREKYYFATIEGMTDQAITSGNTLSFYYADYMNNTEEGQIEAMKKIRSLNLGNRFNTFEERNYGAYRSHATEIDFMNRTVIDHQYNHLAEIPDYRLPSPNVEHFRTQDFVDKYLAEGKNAYVIKDYEVTGAEAGSYTFIRPNQWYGETYTRKTANAYHHDARKITIEINGRSEGIYPGAVIDVNIPKFQFPVEDQLLEQYSGLYIIESVEHKFMGKNFTQSLTLSKSGFDGDPQRAREKAAAAQAAAPDSADAGFGGNPDNNNDNNNNNNNNNNAGSSSISPADPNTISTGYEESGLTQAEVEAVIAEEAEIRGINPITAIEVARSEGTYGYQSTARRPDGSRERSYGPYQLFVDGGLGTEFQRQTGIDINSDRSAESIRKQIQFSLDYAASNGWGPNNTWYGAGRVGISDREGLAGASPANNWRD